jgi:C1A family cysteine protease
MPAGEEPLLSADDRYTMMTRVDPTVMLGACLQNQGQCGSCWAFAATAVVEGQVLLAANKSTTDLSPQQLVE